jgi:putative peptidoglycan lipid II flippase
MNNVFKIISKIFAITIALKILEIVKNLIIASKFGVSSSADIYMAVISIPDGMLILLGIDTIRGVVNSEYSAVFSGNEKEVIFASYRNFIKILFIVATLILIFSFIFRAQIISALLPGFTGEKYLKAVEISFIIFPIVFFKVFLGYFQSIYNAFQKYYTPVTLPLVSTAIIFVAIFLPYYKGDLMYNLSIASLFGSVLITVIMFIGVYIMGGKPDLKFIEFDDLTKKIIRNCFSIFILVICNQSYVLSKNFFASYFGKGAISALNYATYIPASISTLAFSVIFSVLLSKLASGFSSEHKSTVRKLYINTFLGLLFSFIPFIVIFVVFDKEILRLVYLRGNFDIDGINMIILPFFWESLSLFSFVIFIIPTALYLAKKKYMIMSKIGAAVYLSGIFLNYLFVNIFGFYGVSIANFFVTLLYGSLLLFYSRKFIGRYRIYSKHFTLLILSGLITFFIFYFTKSFASGIMNSDSFIPNLFFVLIGSVFILLIYLLISNILKVNYFPRLLEIFSKKNS